MQFGTRKADSTRGSGIYLRRFGKGETKIRLLEETDDWTEYFEHFLNKKGFPCTGDRETCPGCTHPDDEVSKAGRKYATYVKLVKTGHVLPFTIPVSLADALERRAEKNGGSVTNRDYAVTKSGSFFDTVYDVDQEDKYDVDLKAEREKCTISIDECFNEAFVEVWGSLDAKGQPSDPPADKPAAEHVPGDPNPPTEPKGEDATAAASEASEEVLTEAQVRAMGKNELRDLCDKAGVTWDSTDTESELADKLIAEFGS